jgi:hypothetical protein
MAKVVFNNDMGSAFLSDEAISLGEKLDPSFSWSAGDLAAIVDESGVTIPRHHPVLVQIVEELGDEASGSDTELDVHEFEGNMYYIEEHDGAEYVVTLKDMIRIR